MFKQLMGSNGKPRWKISFHKPSLAKSEIHHKDPPPKEFICPISGVLMFDPVVVASGQTFERTSVHVCRELGFSSVLPDGTKPDFSALFPNLALKKTILNWCDTSKSPHPTPPDYAEVEKTVKGLMGLGTRVSETELLREMPEKPPVMFHHATTELNPRHNHFYSSSSEESVIANTPPTPLLPFATRPLCYSSSTTSTSSDFVSGEFRNPNPEEQEFVSRLNSLEVYEQEEAVIELRKLTRSNEQARVSLCTPEILVSLKPLLNSRYSAVQTNSVASLVNLSLENVNKVKILRSGVVPVLIDVLKGGFGESQEHAAGALFSLALEDDNKTAIGVLGAIQPLLHALRSESQRTRHDSSLALYHLSLVQGNRVKLLKLGAVSTLLSILRGRNDLASKVILVICNLAACTEGRSAMLDSNTVECLVGMLRNGTELEAESTRENCVAALYALSQGSMRFKVLAREANAAEVLRTVVEKGSERAREKAKRILMMLRERDHYDDSDDEDEVDWEEVLEGGQSRTRLRVGRKLYGANSTEF